MKFQVVLVLLLSMTAHALPPVSGTWFRVAGPENGTPRGVVLVVHGLNQIPARMNPLCEILRDQGYEVFRLSLMGHRGSLEEFKKVTFSQWEVETRQAYALVRERAAALNVPVHLVGYSLGGLMVESLLIGRREEGVLPPQSVVLLAPALSIRSRSYLVKAFGIFGSSFTVPSRAPEEYRANSGTPMAAYYALFEGVDRLDKSGYRNANIKTLVVVDPDDELVSSSGLAGLKEKHRLTNWELVSTSTQHSTLSRPYHHLIIDEASLGTREWSNLVSRIKRHLQ